MSYHEVPAALFTTKGLLEEKRLKDDLRQRVQQLTYPAFLRLVALLLTRMGYEQVRVAGRERFRGHNSGGGFDLRATLPSPSHREVVIQAKQFAPQQRIYQRSLDELRGACLRANASEAVLLTTSLVSGSAMPGLIRLASLAPIRVIDGEEFRRLLTQKRLGVVPAGNGKLRVDEPFFRSLTSAKNLSAAEKKPEPVRLTRRTLRLGNLTLTVSLDHGEANTMPR